MNRFHTSLTRVFELLVHGAFKRLLGVYELTYHTLRLERPSEGIDGRTAPNHVSR